MTWTPTIQVEYATDWNQNDNQVVNGIVEYNLNIQGGSEDYINPPMPGSTSIDLTFDEDVIPPIQIGNVVTIQDTSVQGIGYIFIGKVVGRSSRYSAWGTAGFLLTWTYELAGFISDLQKMSWYNPSNYTGTTDQCLDLVMANAGKSTWSQVNPNLTWANVTPTTTWETWDGVDYVTNNMISRTGTNSQSQTLAAGWRNVWDDLVTLTYGVWGAITESTGLAVECVVTTPTTITTNVYNNYLMVDIEGIDSTPKLRNDVTLTKYDTTTIEYRDQPSIYQYGQQPGTITTYINNDSDALTTCAKIVNGLAYPYLALDRYRINLYNPNIPQADLTYYYITGLIPVTVLAPTPMGGTQDYLTVGYRLNANKNAWIMENNVVPLSVAVNSINWEQVPASYTWTSYGVAYPTQKWSDL